MLSASKQKFFLIATILVTTVVAFIVALPDPIDIDLTKIGNGNKSVVFIYDPNRLVSNKQAIQMNEARESLGDSVNLLIARTGYPATSQFMTLYNADIAEVLFFNPNGELVDRKYAVVEAAHIVEMLTIKPQNEISQ